MSDSPRQKAIEIMESMTRKITEHYLQNFGRDPTDEELATDSQRVLEEVERLLDERRNTRRH